MTGTIKNWPMPRQLRVPIGGARVAKGLKKNRPVSAGQLLAEGIKPETDSRHAPIAGIVTDLNEFEMVIDAAENAVGEPPEPLDLSGLDGINLAIALKNLGVPLPKVLPGDPLIINAADPEPGLGYAQALFTEHRETIMAGLEVAGRLWPGRKFFWAGLNPGPPEWPFIRLKKYPDTLPALIKKKVTGRNDPYGSGVLGARELFFMGRGFRAGLPLIQVPLTLGRSNYFVPPGSRLIDLLQFANLWPGDGDAVILGGLVRGRTTARLVRGLNKNIPALHLVKKARPQFPVRPCRSCGDCERACPAGLPVGEAASLSSESWLAGHGQEFLAGCLACGACALACPAERPLMAMIKIFSDSEIF